MQYWHSKIFVTDYVSVITELEVRKLDIFIVLIQALQWGILSSHIAEHSKCYACFIVLSFMADFLFVCV
jgi:hypothetical protein